MKDKQMILVALLVGLILINETIRPLLDNMLGRVGLVAAIAYLAKENIILGLLGTLFYISINNGLFEGFKEGSEDGEGEGTIKEEGTEEAFREGAGGDEGEEIPDDDDVQGFREGADHEEDEEEAK